MVINKMLEAIRPLKIISEMSGGVHSSVEVHADGIILFDGFVEEAFHEAVGS